MSATFGPEQRSLGHPSTTRLINQLWPTPRPAEPARRRTQYVIRHRQLGLFFMGLGPSGQRWGGAPEIAYPFEFMTGALFAVFFHLDGDLDQCEIVLVEG